MTDRNQLAVLKHQLGQLDGQRAMLCVWLVSVLRELHGGQARISPQTLTEVQRSIFSVVPSEESGRVVFTVCDKAQRPVVTALPTGLTAAEMAGALCDGAADGLVHLDEDSLAALLVAFYENCKRGEAELAEPKLVEPVTTANEAPIERCPECWLAFGEHRPGCAAAVPGTMNDGESHALPAHA